MEIPIYIILNQIIKIYKMKKPTAKDVLTEINKLAVILASLRK